MIFSSAPMTMPWRVIIATIQVASTLEEKRRERQIRSARTYLYLMDRCIPLLGSEQLIERPYTICYSRFHRRRNAKCPTACVPHHAAPSVMCLCGARPVRKWQESGGGLLLRIRRRTKGKSSDL